MAPEIAIEICVDSAESALAAQRGGASRVELCADLLEGGITPSAGMIELVRSELSIPLQVMVRPRGGDFFYNDEEFEIMRRDIEVAKGFRADGVVIGILDAYGNVDIERTLALVEQARPLSVTFHRAFDMTADLFRALEDVCATRADRILTSGGEQTAIQGAQTIAEVVKKADGRILIMPGSGINAENVRQFIAETGVREIHAGASSTGGSPMQFRNSKIAMGSVPGREYQRSLVREENVRKLRSALSAAE
jgi:copper homeostasis protein